MECTEILHVKGSIKVKFLIMTLSICKLSKIAVKMNKKYIDDLRNIYQIFKLFISFICDFHRPFKKLTADSSSPYLHLSCWYTLVVLCKYGYIMGYLPTSGYLSQKFNLSQ